jgi:hypothetical protein
MLFRDFRLGLGYGYPLCCVLHYCWDGIWGWPSSMTRWNQIATDPSDRLPCVPCGVNRELDLTSLRNVEYHRIGSEGEVPGAVVRSYSNRGRAFQHVSDAGAAWYSAYLFAEKAGKALPEWRPSLMQVIDSLLGPFDVQDLIAAYLQVEHGYIALPARQVDSTLAYEYVLRHPSDGHLAVAQVKTGAQPVETDTLPTADEDLRCFIFSPGRHYPDVLPANVVPIEVEDIAAFIRSKPNALPPVVNAGPPERPTDRTNRVRGTRRQGRGSPHNSHPGGHSGAAREHTTV